MKYDSIPIVDEPVPGFDVADLFLSRTDERGLIKYGNSVFKRLSRFDWPDLIGAPHRKIRHPDMPKALFRLFWDTLQSGQSFGGYIKNRAATGQHYWVFAVVVPVDDGYLSVRLKPTSDILDEIKTLYATLLEAEQQTGQDPAVGKAAILDAIKGMGFRDYIAFSGYALATELNARSGALGRPVDPTLQQFEQISVSLTDLVNEVAQVTDGYEHISDSPRNLNILGSQLKSRREPMQVVAQNYAQIAQEMMASISDLANGLDDLLNTAFAGRLDHCAGLLYSEGIADFKVNEPNVGTTGHSAEVDRLSAGLDAFLAQAVSSCAKIKTEVNRFVGLGDQLRRMVSGLAVTRVICLIEAQSNDEDTTSIEEISQRLGVFQEDLVRSLDRIVALCTHMAKSVPVAQKVEEDEE